MTEIFDINYLLYLLLKKILKITEDIPEYFQIIINYCKKI